MMLKKGTHLPVLRKTQRLCCSIVSALQLHLSLVKTLKNGHNRTHTIMKNEIIKFLNPLFDTEIQY